MSEEEVVVVRRRGSAGLLWCPNRRMAPSEVALFSTDLTREPWLVDALSLVLSSDEGAPHWECGVLSESIVSDYWVDGTKRLLEYRYEEHPVVLSNLRATPRTYRVTYRLETPVLVPVERRLSAKIQNFSSAGLHVTAMFLAREPEQA